VSGGVILLAVLTAVIVGATAGLLGVRQWRAASAVIRQTKAEYVDLVCRRCGAIMPGGDHECSERR